MTSTTEVLALISLDQIDPHPLNANLMSEELRAKLAANIAQSGRYPPLIVRPLSGSRYQLLDGEQRSRALNDLGRADAWCYVWPCTDEEALVLLATLNRLEGMDVPGKRAALIAELQLHQSLADLARLLPEDEAELQQTLDLLDFDVDELVERLSQEAAKAAAAAPTLFTFAVEPDDAPTVEEALEQAMAGLEGKNRRGQALVTLARAFLHSSAGEAAE